MDIGENERLVCDGPILSPARPVARHQDFKVGALPIMKLPIMNQQLSFIAIVALAVLITGPAFAWGEDIKQGKTKILLIYTDLDHAWGSHMYQLGCQLLGKCLEQTEGVEVVVSHGWPTDPEVLDGVRSIVCYTRPAGEVVLVPPAREAFRQLMAKGVGFVALHWATGADLDHGEEYLQVLGGWYDGIHTRLAVTKTRLKQLVPEHPVCRGWEEYDLRDEYYLNLKYHDQAQPILQVHVDDHDETVAWVLERPDSAGGRSFGTTLGHFHDNFAIPAFRQAIVNGILYSAHMEVPQQGASVDLQPGDTRVPPQPQTSP